MGIQFQYDFGLLLGNRRGDGHGSHGAVGRVAILALELQTPESGAGAVRRFSVVIVIFHFDNGMARKIGIGHGCGVARIGLYQHQRDDYKRLARLVLSYLARPEEEDSPISISDMIVDMVWIVDEEATAAAIRTMCVAKRMT
jgi:hypothetical protein